MKRTNIFFRCICLVMLLGSFGVCWGQTAISGTIAGGTMTGNYKLTGTVTISKTIEASGTLTIDLNGQVLNGNGQEYVLKVPSGATLNIKDTNEESPSHAGTLDKDGVFQWTGSTGHTHLIKGGIILNRRTSNDETSTKGILVNGTCNITKASIIGCYTNQIGAAVTVTSSGNFSMKGGQISYNYSKGAALTDENLTTAEKNRGRAGAVYGEPAHGNSGSIINISNTILSDNHANYSGGAICGYNVTLSNCTIENNTTQNCGGGIYMRGIGSSLKIVGSSEKLVQIKKNTAIQGGGIYVSGEFDINYCNLESNYATTNGGGIFAISTTDTKFTGVLRNSTILKNRAMSTEPQDYEKDADGKRKAVNKGRGGGFYFQGKTEDLSENNINPVFTLINTQVTENACMYYGGGGQVCTGATLNLNEGSRIDYNTAVLHGAGGLHVTATARVNINDGSISYNTAHTVGGAIHSSYGCELNFYGGVIQGNYAHQRGGGVHINTGGGMLLQGTQIIGNKVERGKDMQYSTVTESDGIYSWTSPVAETVNSGYILDKDGNVQYSGYGGGVMIDSGTFTMESGLISGNEAEIGGGGVALVMIRIGDQEATSEDEDTKLKKTLGDDRLYNYKVANFNLTGGQITRNKTTGNANASEEERLGFEIGNGGGVYVMENNLKSKLGSSKLTYEKWQEYYLSTKKEGEIITNAEGKYAVYEKLYDDVSKATVNGGSIDNNEATGNGGALFLQQGIVNMDNLTMIDNTATGDGGALHLDNGTLTIGSNKENKITGNNAANGGGVCVANGTLSIGYCDIKQNIASQFGGGVYVANKNEVKIDLTGGGVFSYNNANAGGGMAVSGPIILNFEGLLQNNTANNGGGIYLLKGTETVKGATLNFNGGFIRSNTAECTETLAGNTAIGKDVVKTGDVEAAVGVGGGVFMADYTTLKFDVSNKLGFYGNRATNAADDIFANGNGTSITLPNVSKMTLDEYVVPVPVGSLFWAEDYYSYYDGTKYVADASYSVGTNQLDLKENLDPKQNLRYYYALDQLKSHDHIAKIDVSKFNQEFTGKYVCLTLGYYIYYVTIKKKGLLEGESAMFDIYGKNTGDKPYITMLLSNNPKAKKDGEWIVKKVALPEGNWKVNEKTDWSWAYQLRDEPTTPDKSNEGYVEVKGEGVEFSFTNDKQGTIYMHDEDIEVNKMKYIKVSSGNNE